MAKETILIYNMEGTAWDRTIRMIGMQLGVKVKAVEKTQYSKPLGFLAGLPDVPDNGEVSEGEGFSDKMMIMCGLNSAKLDRLLTQLKRQKLPRIDLKAVMTEHNRTWSSAQLHDELLREHEYIQQRQKKKD